MSSSSSSSSSSSDGSTDGLPAPKPAKNQLLDEDSDGEDDLHIDPTAGTKDGSKTSRNDNGSGGILRVNAKYAKEYEARKRREELTKHRHEDTGDISESDASTSESEDEEADLLTPQLDAQILKTIKALRSGDGRVYDRDAKFFDEEENEEEGAEESGGGGERKFKAKKYKDVVREQILEQMDDEDEGGERGTHMEDERKELAYDDEQRHLREAFLESTRDDDDDDAHNANNGSDDDEWIAPKAKKSHAPLEDDAARKLWEEELHNPTTGKGGNKSPLADPKGEVDDGDRFLLEFMTHRKWMEQSSDGRLGGTHSEDNDEEDDEDSLEELDRTDAFESRYNFRFEEATDANANANHDPSGTASGAAHSIVHYSRASNSTNVLRRKDDSRRQKRLERKERKLAERKAKEEKLRRLKNAKREELEGRMEKVRSVLGYDASHGDKVEGAEGAAGLGKAEEEMILKLMEGEYDPDKFEQVMNTAYGDEYYAKEDGAWKSDVDVKRDLLADGEDVGIGEEAEEDDGGGGLYDDAEDGAEDGAEDDEAYDEHTEEPDAANDDDEHPWEEHAPAESSMYQKLRAKVQDELYKLDYEDIVGDMPTRFKYRTVAKNDYGLSTEEILYARDSTLKQFVSLKKMAPYAEDGEYQPGTKRRKRFRQMLKAEKTEEQVAKENAAAEDKVVGEGDGADEDGKKKKRRRQKKGGSKNASDATKVEEEDGKEGVSNENANDTEEAAAPKAEAGEPEKKRRRRKKKKGPDAAADATAKEHTKDDSNVAVDNVQKEAAPNEVAESVPKRTEAKEEKKSSKKKKDKVKNKRDGDGGKKKQRKHKGSGVEGVPSARLAAYGF